jgi:glycosyltransferase involved in cell wall biosynthesis
LARLLVVTNIFPPMIGGPATFADGLARKLAARGHSVRVVCSSSGSGDAGDAERPFKVLRVSMDNRYLYEVKVRLRLLVEFLRHRHILVIGLEPYVDDIAKLAPRSYLLRVPGDTVWENARHYGTYGGRHEAFLEAEQPALIKGIAAKRRSYLRRARAIIAPSHHLASLVQQWLPDAPTIRVIENGAPADIDVPLREPPGKRRLRALFVGRLINWKGIETILIAAANLTDVDIEICGEGPELPMLMALHCQLGAPDHIRFCGKISAAEVKKRMAAADVFLQTSELEGMSNSLLEACASGMVPIVSDIAANREVVEDGVSALLVPYGAPAALRTAMERLRDNPELFLRLSEGARAAAERLPFGRTVDAYADLIEEMAR